MKRILIIEREFGAGGSVIAEKAAQRLGWKLFDHALTEAIAALAKVNPEMCRQREERVDSWLYRLAKVFWRGSYERSMSISDSDVFDTDRLVCLAREVIERAAATGSCVIVGRGAPYFLREREDAFCVFLYAPRDLKFRRVRTRVSNEKEALELVDTVDEERHEFVQHYFGKEWPSRHLYDAMLNTSIGDDETVEAILYLINVANRREEARRR
jgi:cytidylate kinase